MWKKKKSESKLPSKINYRFIEVDGECTIIIGKNTYLKSKKKLQELEVYDLIIKGKIEGEKLEAIFLKDQVVKKDDIAKELADKAKENLEYKDGKYYRPPFPVSLPEQLVTAYGNKDLTKGKIKALD